MRLLCLLRMLRMLRLVTPCCDFVAIFLRLATTAKFTKSWGKHYTPPLPSKENIQGTYK